MAKSKHKDLVTASLTTIPGREESLKDTVNSLLPQVDKLNVYLHGYKELPLFLQHKKIEVAFDLEWGDKGDLDKFFWVDDVKGWHFICDDDIIFPSDYVKHMISKAEEYKRQRIIGLHGVIPFNPPIASYYQDRIVYPCLGDLSQDIDVPLLGTSSILYHTEHVPLKTFEYKPLMANMADIHIAIWAGVNKIGMVVVAHKGNWLKHTTKIDMKKTIFEQTVNDDYFPTKHINDNSEYFRTRRPTGEGPLVSIICVNTRLRTNRQWVKEAYDSFREQNYGNLEIVVVDNERKMITIGKAFNEGVKAAKGEYVLFVGDDDMISYDYVSTLVTMLMKTKGDPKVVGATSYLTMFHYNYQTQQAIKEPRELIPTGMWRREFLVANPFCEYLTKYVDTELMERAKDLGYLYPPAQWHYGYYYRSHESQVSGHKALNVERGLASHRTDEIKEQIKKVMQ